MIRDVAVIGAGTMGHGIAQVAAMAGHEVALTDATGAIAQSGLRRIGENLDGGIARGKITAEQRDSALSRIRIATDLRAAVHSADLVIEAVPERLDLKVTVLREIGSAARTDAILASNTSGFSITELQTATASAGRVIGLHFFNPVHINQLVEVVRGERTTEATVTASVEFVRGLGKEPIVVRDSPGFATSRLGVLLGLEAMRMVEEGVASAEDIDKAMELGYRHPMGPLKLTDLVGLDVRLAIAEYLHARLGSEAFRAPRLLRDMVANGHLGKKAGRGFYDWTHGD